MHAGFRARELSFENDGLYIYPIVRLETPNRDGKVELSGTYPYSGSIEFVKVRDSVLTNVTKRDWGDEHFAPIIRLYEWYNKYNVDFTTASYDFYCVYSDLNSNNRIVMADDVEYDFISSSYTVEAMIKPFTVTGSDDFIIMDRAGTWRFYIEGDGSKLAFSASDNVYTSSLTVGRNRWNRVSFSATAGTGTFYIGSSSAGTVNLGGDVSASAQSIGIFGQSAVGTSNRFHGLGLDFRIWSIGRTAVQHSASYDRTLWSSGSTDLKLYVRLNDGPRSSLHGKTLGSGAFDYSPTANHGTLTSFDGRYAPVWHPCDNSNFVVKKEFAREDTPSRVRADVFRVLHVPSMFYGRSIKSGSVRLVDNAFIDHGIKRVLVDDGRGGLYVSGSIGSSSFDDMESYLGVRWNKVGNVFYDEGLIVLKDPAILDFAEDDGTSTLPNDLLQVSFRGEHRVPTNIYMCRVGPGQANASNNPTYTTRNVQRDKLEVIRETPTTYVSSIGLYDKERRLVAVAKIASPTRKREKDRVNWRLKIDF